jgi:hypothetical protein
MVEVRAYAAGASLFLPMVIKNREISWKQLSKTRSTANKDVRGAMPDCTGMTDLGFPAPASPLECR